ncbi:MULTISPECIES: FGGY-family carbohydrate kinase [unclassified Actinotalea]|uniref:xylulokinase n=1 Tax=unclassified Actinotalea TaxID=2638618 RepID=UPI0015F4D39C|nr:MULTISPECIES: FGGY family carbohydrate kinase [unclassified Actinotalea]
MTLVLAVDCSTTAAKAVVEDADGRVVASASRPITTSSPRPGWHEQDPARWWDATRDAAREAIAALPDPAAVGAVCVTHQRESFACLDETGAALRPAILWLDARAHAEIAALGTDRVHDVSGKPPDTTPAIYKLAWLSRHEPAVLRDAARVGDVQAYLCLQLTGRWATSAASADTLGLLDLRTHEWSPELLALAGVRAAQLPELVPDGEVLGLLTAGAAGELGLPGPLPLVAGLGDGQAAGLALGAAQDGVAYLNLGTSMVLGVTSPEYRWDPAFRTLAGMVPGTWTLETVLNAAAYVASWCREQFGGGTPGDALEAAAAALPPGAEGLLTLPYWNAAQTPHWDPLARGAVVGWHGRHTPAHLYRSILEGVAFELRLHLDRLEAATGHRVDVVRAVGGGARSPLWVQVVADVTGRTVRVCSAGEISAAGAAALARGHLAGGAPDVHLPDGHDVVPDPRTADVYARLFAAQSRLYPALRDVFAELADLREHDAG